MANTQRYAKLNKNEQRLILLKYIPLLLAVTSPAIGYFNVLKTLDINTKKVIIIGDVHATHPIEASQGSIMRALLKEGALKKTALLLERSEEYFEEEEASLKAVEKFDPTSKRLLIQELGRLTHKKNNFNNISVIWCDSRTTILQEMNGNNNVATERGWQDLPKLKLVRRILNQKSFTVGEFLSDYDQECKRVEQIISSYPKESAASQMVNTLLENIEKDRRLFKSFVHNPKELLLDLVARVWEKHPSELQSFCDLGSRIGDPNIIIKLDEALQEHEYVILTIGQFHVDAIVKYLTLLGGTESHHLGSSVRGEYNPISAEELLSIFQSLTPLKTIAPCSLCQTIGPKLTCSRCKAVNYCSAQCQKNDWPKHKKSCSH